MTAAGLPLRTPWRGAVVLAVFAIAPLMGYLGPLGFAVLVPVGGLLLAPFWARPRDAWPVIVLFAALVLWAGGSSGWSAARPVTFAEYDDLEQVTALKLVLQLALYSAFAVGAARLSGRSAERAYEVLGWGVLAMALVLLAEGFTGAALYQWFKQVFEDPIRPDLAVRNVGQGSVLLALLAWPVLLHLRGRRPWAMYAVVVAVLISSVMLGQASPAAAFLIGGVFVLVVRRFGRAGARAIAAVLAAGILAAPFLLIAAQGAGVLDTLARSLPASWEARLVIWPWVAERVVQHPLFGWGLDASRTIGGPVPLHPHNAPLQIWLELGAVGAAVLALAWAWIFARIGEAARLDRAGAAACAGAAGAYFAVGALSYGVWQEWWLALGALTAAACVVLLAARARALMAERPQLLQTDELTPL
jgi:O-antigen ligase